MLKILLAIDAGDLRMPVVDFACYLGKLTNSKITGVFLENRADREDEAGKKSYYTRYIGWDTADPGDKTKLIEQNISLFKQACENRSVSYALHRGRNIPAAKIINESRFADLVIADASSSFNKAYEGMPTAFVKDILKQAECPVIIAPAGFDSIDEIVFAFDGSRSAGFAMKQFSYIFPELYNRKATVLQVNREGSWTDRNRRNLGEWIQNHYLTVEFEALKGDPATRLFEYMLERKNAFLVMGAYGRNILSGFFKPSHANELIRSIAPPVFIAHG